MWLTAGVFHASVDTDVEAFASVSQLVTGGDVVPLAISEPCSRYPNLRR